MNEHQPISKANKSYIQWSQPIVPVLQICCTSSNSVVLDIAHESEGQVDGYRLLYRTSGENAVQQQEFRRTNPMQYQELSDNKSRLMLSGLSSNTEYVLTASTGFVAFGDMHSNTNRKVDHTPQIWSKESNAITFRTYDGRTKANLITTHWFRTNTVDPNVSYEFLVAVIIRFCTPKFKWDIAQKHDELTLSDNCRTITRHAIDDDTALRSICSKNMISAESAKGSIVRWQMTMKRKGSATHEKLGPLCKAVALTMGYIAAEHSKTGPFGGNVASNRHAVGLHLADDSHPFRFIEGFARILNMDARYFWEDNDRMELQFDFQTGSCAGYYNGHFMGLLTKRKDQGVSSAQCLRDLPNEFYLYATVWADNCVFQARLLH